MKHKIMRTIWFMSSSWPFHWWCCHCACRWVSHRLFRAIDNVLRLDWQWAFFESIIGIRRQNRRSSAKTRFLCWLLCAAVCDRVRLLNVNYKRLPLVTGLEWVTNQWNRFNVRWMFVAMDSLTNEQPRAGDELRMSFAFRIARVRFWRFPPVDETTHEFYQVFRQNSTPQAQSFHSKTKNWRENVNAALRWNSHHNSKADFVR